MSKNSKKLLNCVILWLCASSMTVAMAQTTIPPSATLPARALPGAGGAVSSVGPGDVLQITIYGQPDLSSQVTVSADGGITVPFLGVLAVDKASPSTIARRIEAGLRRGGYLADPTVSVEVMQVNSRIVSILGEVQRPGRYAIESRLSLLELLALAGGIKNDADENITVMRHETSPDKPRREIKVVVGNRAVPSADARNLELQPGDIVYVPAAPLFFTYGEVGKPGAYPMEQGMNVMRALSLAGGLTPRASNSGIFIKRTNQATGKVESTQAQLTDEIHPGDVIYVDERWF